MKDLAFESCQVISFNLTDPYVEEAEDRPVV